MDKLSIPSMLCMYDVPGDPLKMIQDDRIWKSYMQCGMMLWHLLTSSLLTLLLKSLLSFVFLYSHYAKCTNQDSNCVYAGTILWHKYDDTNMIWYVCNGRADRWSLMCTSNVAGNTQMASLDRQVTQNGLGVNNAIARGIYNDRIPRYKDDMEVTVNGNDVRRCSWCRNQDDVM